MKFQPAIVGNPLRKNTKKITSMDKKVNIIPDFACVLVTTPYQNYI